MMAMGLCNDVVIGASHKTFLVIQIITNTSAYGLGCIVTTMSFIAITPPPTYNPNDNA